MSDQSKQLPYETLGNQLKRLREDSRESLAEVSGAVEIEEKMLTRIEDGRDRPSEDILLLLISHFAVEDDKAAELWELAGYDKQLHSHDDDTDDAARAARTQAVMIMIDPRVMYSDSAEIIANRQGIVLNFSQTTDNSGHPLTVSRIGMSETQAKLLMGLLHQALYNLDNPGGRKELPGGRADEA
jgi:transcriptional regulator with XRE-family HTH domain